MADVHHARGLGGGDRVTMTASKARASEWRVGRAEALRRQRLHGITAVLGSVGGRCARCAQAVAFCACVTCAC